MINVSFHAPSLLLRLKPGSAPGVNHLQQQHKSWQGAHLHSKTREPRLEKIYVWQLTAQAPSPISLDPILDLPFGQRLRNWLKLDWQFWLRLVNNNNVCKISYKVNEADDMLSLWESDASPRTIQLNIVWTQPATTSWYHVCARRRY